MKNGKPASKRRRYFKRGVFIFFVIMAALSIYSLDRVWSSLNKSYQPIERLTESQQGRGDKSQNDDNAKDQKKPQDPISILILGVDSRPSDIGRTDTMIVAVLDPESNRVTLSSLPRDTYVDIIGKGYKSKVNHAYQYGLPTVLATVEEFYGIPIDYYMTIDFQGFKNAVDELGGVDIDVEKDMQYVDRAGGLYIDLKKGYQTLDGEQALGYSRFRSDSAGDLGRIERQQKVIKALVDKSTDFRSATKIFGLVDLIGEHMATDLTPGQMVKWAASFADLNGDQVGSVTVNGTPDRFGEQNLWYIVIDDAEKQRIQTIMKARYEGNWDAELNEE